MITAVLASAKYLAIYFLSTELQKKKLPLTLSCELKIISVSESGSGMCTEIQH